MTTAQSIRKKHVSLIAEVFEKTAPFKALSQRLSENEDLINISGLSGSSESFLINALCQTQSNPIVVVTPTSEAANDLYDDLTFLIGEEAVGHFPSRQILPYDFKAPVGEIMGRRISTLSNLIDNKLQVVICPIRALLEPTITKDDLENNRLHFSVGDEIELEELVDKLVTLGFNRVPNVEEVGDFAMRGGVIDFFSPGDSYPIRIEMFGDEIDTIRKFDVSTQRTVEKVRQVSMLPKREILISTDSLEKYLSEINSSDADYIRNRFLNDPELPGLEWLAILFGLKQGHLFDFLPDDTLIITEHQDHLESETDTIFEEARQLYSRFRSRLNDLPEPDKYYKSKDDIISSIKKHPQINHLPFKKTKAQTIDFGCQPHPSFGARLDLLGNALNGYHQLEMIYFIAVDTTGQADRLTELIAEKSKLMAPPIIESADLKGGFVCSEGGFALLTDHEIFSRHHRRVRRKKFKEGVAITDYTNLNKSDFVVHTDYGIARYHGLETLTIEKRNRDCLLLYYANNDKLFVPIEEFNRVSRYAGKEATPVLTQLGGPAWDKLKKKTKKAIEVMASDLIKLYAVRKQATGHNFGEDTVWLKQLEASFPYEETVDQAKAIIDVKNDMASDQAMDRLVCGDVGFGKTEVAVRGAFKAIENGKQVAVLVPTTILAQQHYITFKERFDEFPVKVEMLSRFRTKKEQEGIVEEVSKGKIDLIVGTHRLFSKDIQFDRLGLLIIDEEHRFGVKHKEKLRELKANVDTISMTATPIPRTLQMSLISVRDMSLITTSPKDRLPIITEIAEFDPGVISSAVIRELNRGGQVFFVHNRVQTIDAMYNYLKKIVPQAQIAVAHGQMHEKSLEGIMMGFMSKRFDILLCTSIIESGLDIPNANTIIINRADRFGLAQLYQLRGRVGRSSRRAYAYLLTPPTRLLSMDGVRRLRAIEAHSDLGSGFALAMRDLEIRGAGSILGHKQSGFIEEIGFDMYNKLLEEAIANIKGEELRRPPETKMETDIEMYLPNEYINNRQQKVDIYRRLADAATVDDIELLRDEVLDRFGKLPISGLNLFDGIAAKVLASHLLIEKVKLKRGIANLFFKDGRQLTRKEVERLHKATDCPMEFSLTGRVQVVIDMLPINESARLLTLKNILGNL